MLPDTSLLPFYHSGWSPKQKEAAHALWMWYLHFATHASQKTDRSEPFISEERTRAEAAQPLQSIPVSVSQATYFACEQHNLPLSLLADQVEAAGILHASGRFDTYGPLRQYVLKSASAHARLLGRLAGFRGSWQFRYVDELGRAFFHVRCLMLLPEDLNHGRLFIPLDELDQLGISVDQLKEGALDESVRKLLWRQEVRARDAFAQALPLVHDIFGIKKLLFKQWWMGGLEMLNEIARREYDVWKRPLALSPFQRFQVRFQALFGRTTFRK